METKTLVLIRHAHRDVTDRDNDNGLSEKGLKQAQEIADHFQKKWSKKDRPLLLSSAKLRCIETLIPLAKNLKTEIEISDDLMEQLRSEDETDFLRRIKKFLNKWKTELPSLTVICSHGDWLPLALEQLTGDFIDFKKGAWIQVQLKEGKVKIMKKESSA